MIKPLYGFEGPFSAPRSHPLRSLAARTLRGASRQLARLSRQLAAGRAAPPARSDPLLEFHAEAGAPEGALYVDGRLVGHLPGVTRL